MRKLVYILFILIMVGCNQNEIKRLKNELKVKDSINSILSNKIDSIKFNYDSLRHEYSYIFNKHKILNEEILKERRIKKYSNSEIISIVKKDRQFYCPSGSRRNFSIKNIDKNIYDVSFELKLNHNRDWGVSVFRIKFLPENKYILEHTLGRVCL